MLIILFLLSKEDFFYVKLLYKHYLQFYAIFSSISDIVFLTFLFSQYNNVYPKYYQGYVNNVSQRN